MNSFSYTEQPTLEGFGRYSISFPAGAKLHHPAASAVPFRVQYGIKLIPIFSNTTSIPEIFLMFSRLGDFENKGKQHLKSSSKCSDCNFFLKEVLKKSVLSEVLSNLRVIGCFSHNEPYLLK